jgi:hypothetical protein
MKFLEQFFEKLRRKDQCVKIGTWKIIFCLKSK